ncbi:MAG: hypothetical protein WDA71_11705 [Actinomycetota bacterium]
MAREADIASSLTPVTSDGQLRHLARFLASVTTLFFTILTTVGCTRGSWGPSRFAETPERYWTALEAYELIKPAMLEWHEDAYVVNLFAPLRDERPGWGLQADGRVPVWTFIVVSPSSLTKTGITLVHENEITIGLDGHPERPITAPGLPVPMDQITDSNLALKTARGAGISISPTGITLADYDAELEKEIPLSWLLFYAPLEGGELRVFIDAHTGELIRNGFAD